MLAVPGTTAANVEQVHVLPLPLREPQTNNDGKSLSKGTPPRGSGPCGKGSRSRAKIILKGIAQLHRVIHGTLPCVKITNNCKFGKKCSFLHKETDRQTQKAKRCRGNRSVALFWSVKHLGCVSQDAEPRKVRSILWKSTNSLRPKRRVQFAPEAFAFGKKFGREEQSLGVTQHTHPHERAFDAPKFEGQIQEDTLAIGRRARREVLEMARHVCKIQGDLDQKRATFFSPSEVLVSSCAIICQTRGKIICCRLRSIRSHADQERPTCSRTGNSKSIQKHFESHHCKWGSANEELTVYVKDLEIFVMVQLLEDTPPVLSLGQPCKVHGYSLERTSGQKPYRIKHGTRIPCNTENNVPVGVPGLSSGS